MATYRWYVLGLRVPNKPAEGYVFEGWSRTKEAANARIDKLDRQGRRGVKVYSKDRRQAAGDMAEVYGFTVVGYPFRSKAVR